MHEGEDSSFSFRCYREALIKEANRVGRLHRRVIVIYGQCIFATLLSYLCCYGALLLMSRLRLYINEYGIVPSVFLYGYEVASVLSIVFFFH